MKEQLRKAVEYSGHEPGETVQSYNAAHPHARSA